MYFLHLNGNAKAMKLKLMEWHWRLMSVSHLCAAVHVRQAGQICDASRPRMDKKIYYIPCWRNVWLWVWVLKVSLKSLVATFIIIVESVRETESTIRSVSFLTAAYWSNIEPPAVLARLLDRRNRYHKERATHAKITRQRERSMRKTWTSKSGTRTWLSKLKIEN